MITRREMLGAGVALGTLGTAAMKPQKPFNLKYAPHFGMFSAHAGDNPVAQLEFAAAEGFTAWEDNGMKGRSVEEQSGIAEAMERLGITMGVFVAHSIGWSEPTLTRGGEHIDSFVADLQGSVEVAKRVNAKWMTVVPGVYDRRQDRGYQTTNVIEAMRRGAEVFEPHGLVMVLEPLNFRDHPNMFLEKSSECYQICRAVGSPACKVLFDAYHLQIGEGNLIPNLDRSWGEIEYIQVGDNPGRNEPTTGEINYLNLFSHIHDKGFDGVVGMEHGKSGSGREGERALIEAYRKADSF